MGVDPSGRVFWGFPMNDSDGEPVKWPWEPQESDEYEEPEYDEDGWMIEDEHDSPDWEEVFATKKGLNKPDPETATEEEKSAYWRALNELEKSSPVTVELAGSDYSMINCVVIKESFVSVEWSEIQPFSPEVKPEWEQQLRDWCDLMGVPYRQPGWHVASLYF